MVATRRPIWLGIVLTPWLTPMVFMGLYAAYFVVMGDNRPGLSWLGSLGFSYLFGVPLGYVGVGLLGWPWVAALRRWNKLTIGYVCLGAIVIGMVLFMAFGLVVGNPHYILTDPTQQLAIGLIIGLLSGFIFCLVAGVPVTRVTSAPMVPVTKPEANPAANKKSRADSTVKRDSNGAS